MSKPLRALTLVNYINNRLILHEDVLKKVLESEEARNRPVAIISVAGMFRKGKSFFLNFILRYLKSKDDPNWIDSQIGPLVGFDWRPDHEGVTSGITIWPEVFVVNNVAVMLIDTQGLYESSKNTVEDTYIMVLSFLFSSIQIMNHQENLNSSDLKNFEFFAKYGIALESKTTNIKGFQNLMFLIRDWKYEKLHAYGLESGNTYLKSFLKTNISEELHSVRETIEYFEKVDCFLMPYPGETVARSDEFKGDIGQIDSKFLDNMKDLVEGLIVNVKPKELLGIKANGECVFQVMKNYIECLNNGELPAPKSLIQLQIDILQSNAEKECMRIYNNSMSNGTKEKLLDNAEMDVLHKECSEAALKIFDDLPDFGNLDKIITAKSNYYQIMDASEYKSAMEVKVKSHMHALKIEAERESLKIFNDGMTKVTKGELVEKSQMKKLHKKFAAAALEIFDKIPIIFGYKELIESAKLQCSKVIEASDYKSRMEEQVKHHVLTIANNSEKKCMVIYNDGMKKGTSGKFLNNTEMDILHKDCATASLKVFDKLPNLGYPEEIENAKLQCLKMIEASVYKEGMEEKVKSHVNTLQNNTEKECMMIFNNGMTKETNGKFLKNSEMDNLHKEFAAEALKVFDNLQHYGNHDQLKNAKLQCAKMIERSDFKFRMEEKVKHHVFTLKTDSERECMTIYNGGMTKGSSGKLLNTSEMDNLHKECTNAALKVFDKFPDLGYQDEIKDAKQQCLKMIEASDYKEKMEEKVKSHMNTLQNNAEKECMMIYNNGMTKATKGTFLNNSEMDNLHKEFATEALKVFDNLQHYGNQDQLKIAKLQCTKMIETSDYMSRMEEKVKHHEFTLKTNSERECMTIYNEEMSKGTSGKLLNNSEMDKLHKECTTTALKVFDKLTDLGNQEEIKDAKQQCLKMIEAIDYKKRMEENVKSHLNNMQNNAEKECMMIYNNGMTKATKGKFLQNSEMDNLHKEFAAEALKVFDNLQHYGNQDQQKKAKLQCEKMIETSDYKSRMQEKVKSQMNTLQSNAEKECMMIYTNGMINGTKGKLLKIAEMEKLHNDCKSAALEEFNNISDFGNQNQIKNAIFQCSKMIESSDFKSRMEEKVKMQELTLINEAKEKCMEIYNDNMRKEVAKKILNNSKMEEIHTYFAASALEVFDNLSDFGCQEEVRTAKSKCVQMIEASDYKSRMEEKVKSEMNTFQSNAERECMIIYIDEMKRGTEKKLLKNAEMDDLHKKCLAEALKVFDGSQDFGNQEQLNILKTKCSKMMNATDFKIRMEDKWKMQVSTKIIQAKDECLEIYNENMKREIRNKSLINSEMEKVHMECAASALKVFDNLPDFINQEEIRIAKSKCSQLIEASDYMTRMEEKVKMESSTQLSQAKDECMEIYNVNMRRNTRDKFLKKSEMHGLHNKNESAALKVFENLSDNIGQEEIRTAKSKCSQMMEASDYISVMEGKVKDKLQKILEQSKNNYSNSLKQHAKNSKDIATFKQQTSLCRNGAINDFKSIASFADTELITELLNSLIQFMNQQNSECEDNFRSKRPVDELEDAKNTPNASPEENKADDLAKGLGEDALLAAAGLAAGPAAPYVAIIAGARAAARVFNNIFK